MKIISFFPVESPAVAGAEEEDFELNEDANSFDEMVCDVTIQINFGRHLCKASLGSIFINIFCKAFFQNPFKLHIKFGRPQSKTVPFFYGL